MTTPLNVQQPDSLRKLTRRSHQLNCYFILLYPRCFGFVTNIDYALYKTSLCIYVFGIFCAAGSLGRTSRHLSRDLKKPYPRWLRYAYLFKNNYHVDIDQTSWVLYHILHNSSKAVNFRTHGTWKDIGKRLLDQIFGRQKYCFQFIILNGAGICRQISESAQWAVETVQPFRDRDIRTKQLSTFKFTNNSAFFVRSAENIVLFID